MITLITLLTALTRHRCPHTCFTRLTHPTRIARLSLLTRPDDIAMVTGVIP